MMIRLVAASVVMVAAIGSWLGAAPGELSAQSPDLAEVRDAIAEARYPEARTLLEGWWNADSGAADRRTRQEALWLRARLAPDPQVAELDYRRLVIEFPGGAYSDGALLRLAQGAEARGELGTARSYLQILVRDYPGSEYRVEARDRIARLPAEGAAGQSVEAAVPAPPGADADTVTADTTIADIDTVDIVTVGDTVIQRDASTLEAALVVDTATTVSVPEPPIADEAEEQLTGAYTIQLGAFSTSDRAEALADRARAAGLSVRVVQVEGSSLFRVRQGGFESRNAAEAAADAPRDLGFEALVSADREAERSPG